MKRNLQKTSLTLDPELVEAIDYVSHRLGVSRSAIVSYLLTDAAPQLKQRLLMLPYSAEPIETLRSRGESAESVKQRLDALLEPSE